MPWLELRINSSREDAPQVEDSLLAAGALSVTLQDNADEPIFEPALGETPLWAATRVTGLFEASANTGAVERRLTLAERGGWSWQLLEDRDWEREWMKDFAPLQCGPGLWICPTWAEPPEPEAVNIMLDPGLAFGTGSHPTTYLCLQWLAGQPLRDKSFIDYGCGSGILAVAAALLGAKPVFGVDIDPQALLATRANAERNQLPDQYITVSFPDGCKAPAADVVVANILAGPLVELAPVVDRLVKPGGLLCLSGILEEQAHVVVNAYSERFSFEPLQSRQGWVRLVARKSAIDPSS